MLVIYIKRAISLTQFCDWVGEFVRTRHVDIILGDFNINLLGKPVATSSSALTNFIQIVKEPTHLSGSLIDHVYIHQDLLGIVNAEVKNFDVYFSDHDAIQISLTDKSDSYISNTLHFLNLYFSQNASCYQNLLHIVFIVVLIL